MLYYEGIRYIYINQTIWNQSIKTNDITSRLMEIDVLEKDKMHRVNAKSFITAKINA